MSKRGLKINVKINLTNRWLYTLIAIGILTVISVGVYASTFVNSATNTGHDLSEIQSCAEGQIMQTSGGSWSCVNMPSGVTDTRCDVSGACSQVCIEEVCETSWPKGVAIYTRDNAGCAGDTGEVVFSPTCLTKCWWNCANDPNWGSMSYYECDGSIDEYAWVPQQVCANTLRGYLVN